MPRRKPYDPNSGFLPEPAIDGAASPATPTAQPSAASIPPGIIERVARALYEGNPVAGVGWEDANEGWRLIARRHARRAIEAMIDAATTWDVAIKWSPAWLDQPADDPTNYDHAFFEAVTLAEAFEHIGKFANSAREVVLTPAVADEPKPTPLMGDRT